MSRRHLVLAVLLLASVAAAPASAQTLVYDPTAVGKLVQQYENALQQLDQLKVRTGVQKDPRSGVIGVEEGPRISMV